MEAERTVAVISLPGDRSDRDMQSFGELAGKTFDKIIIREDDNTRGRARGEISELLRQAVVGAGKNPDEVEIIIDELQAAQTAVDRSEKGDLVILMVDKPEKIWEQLTGEQAE